MNAPPSRDPRDHFLDDSEIDDIFARHVQPVIEAHQRFPNSTIVPIMGQVASGKTTLATVMPERLGVVDAYIVEHDDYERLHPSFVALRDAFGEMEAREVIDATESIDHLFDKVLDFGLSRGYNLAVTGPMATPDWVAARFTQWRNDYGARVEVVALAVHEARSQLSTLDRFRQETELTGNGRDVDQVWHDKHYPGVLRSLQRIEDDGLADSVTVVARGGRRVYRNRLISTDPAVVWRDPPHAVAATETERLRLWTLREHSDFYQRAMAVDEFARNGGLTTEQAGSAALALRRGLAHNDQAVTTLRSHASRLTSPQAADGFTQQADRRAQYNREISAAADRLDALAGSRLKGRAAAARTLSGGLGRSLPPSPSSSPSRGMRTGSAPTPPHRGPARGASPSR